MGRICEIGLRRAARRAVEVRALASGKSVRGDVFHAVHACGDKYPPQIRTARKGAGSDGLASAGDDHNPRHNPPESFGSDALDVRRQREL